MTQDSAATKNKILKAAAKVVRDKGAAQLTLEAVAKQAKISKGGLLYHYPNKSALLAAMVVYLNDSFEQAIEDQINRGENKITWLEAYVAMSFDPNHSQIAETAGIMAAVANDLSLLAPLKERYQIWQKKVENSGLEPDLANIVRLAADGLWFNELFNISPLTEKQRSQILAALLTLIQEQKSHDSTQ